MREQSLPLQNEAGTLLVAISCFTAAQTVSVAMLEAVLAGSPWGSFTRSAFWLNLLIAVAAASIRGLRSSPVTSRRITASLASALLGLFLYLVVVCVGLVGVARFTLDNLRARSLSQMTRPESVVLAGDIAEQKDLRRLWQTAT